MNLAIKHFYNKCYEAKQCLGYTKIENISTAFFIANANPEENPDKHSCLREYRMSLISLQEITPRLMNNRSY